MGGSLNQLEKQPLAVRENTIAHDLLVVDVGLRVQVQHCQTILDVLGVRVPNAVSEVQLALLRVPQRVILEEHRDHAMPVIHLLLGGAWIDTAAVHRDAIALARGLDGRVDAERRRRPTDAADTAVVPSCHGGLPRTRVARRQTPLAAAVMPHVEVPLQAGAI